MALVLPDRVKETATTAGTGTFTLAGAVAKFQSFSAVGNGNTTYYCIQHETENEFEVGLGTYTASGTTLSRDTILTSTNSNNAVNFSAGDKTVFVVVPGDKTIRKDGSGAANITSSDVTTALGFTPISSADGGNAATLDSLDSTSFLRSDADDSMTGLLTLGTSSSLSGQGALSLYRSSNPWIAWYSGSTSRGAYLQYVGSGDYFLFGEASYTQSEGSFRAPIFYDSDNTAYYANLTSADVSIVTNADIVTSGQYGAGVVSVYDPTKNQGVWSMGTSYRLPKSGVGGGSLYGLAWSYNPNYGGSGNNAQSISGLNHQLLLMQNGSTTAAMGSGVWTSGNVTAYSDIRVKTNIERIPDALNKVMQLNGYTFDRTDQGEDSATGEPLFLRQTGVIAQEVLPVLPEAVIGDEETHYSVAYGNMVGLLIEAIKELKAEMDVLKGVEND